MTAIGPGTPLICVDASDGGPNAISAAGGDLTPGALYFVADMFSNAADDVCERDHCGAVFLVLHGKPSWYGYCPNRFRPLNDGNTDLVDVHQEIYDMIVQGVPA